MLDAGGAGGTAALWGQRPSHGSGQGPSCQWERTGCPHNSFRPHFFHTSPCYNFFFISPKQFVLLSIKKIKVNKESADGGSSFTPLVWHASFLPSLCAHPRGVFRDGESHPRPPLC